MMDQLLLLLLFALMLFLFGVGKSRQLTQFSAFDLCVLGDTKLVVQLNSLLTD